MMSRVLRSRTSVDYSIESKDESVFTVESASKWIKDTTKYMNIKVTDVHEMFPRTNLPNQARSLIIPEWTDGEWLRNIDVKASSYDNKVKTIISKIRKVFVVDPFVPRGNSGFIESLLHILCFDDYPCLLYSQYSYLANIGPDSCRVKAKPDF